MRLLRVEVPKFRALEKVKINFEPDFNPQVFPLGSLNGGGKSTLLQLIFVLLNCSLDNNGNNVYIKNLLENIEIEDDCKTIATFNILIDGEIIVFSCLLTKEDYFRNKFYSEIKSDRKPIEKYFPPKEFKKPLRLTIEPDDSKSYENMEEILEDFRLHNEIENKKLNNILKNKNIVSIADLSSNKVFFQFDKKDDLDKFKIIKQKIFLISPSNQSYLFLSREERRALFTKDNKPQYDQAVKNAQENLSNFFTFDFTDILAEVFNKAHAEDGRERIRTGRYGTNVEQLENSINSLFVDEKKIVPFIPEQERHVNITVQGVTFKLPSGEEIYPEDLSHGELKRLAIFVLIKYHEMQDSVVLIDEIENGFHPDWQYKIVRDLIEWGKNNQYILATHSYELCTAVTPAHVKELEPCLTK